MSENKNISGTAFIIAAFRAEENNVESPLYTDKIVDFFLDEETKAIAQSIAQNSPVAKGMVKLRTKYFDDVLSKQISHGYKQIVILGSGLDTRAVRYKVEGVKYFEIDNQATLQLKAEILNISNVRANVTYIPGD